MKDQRILYIFTRTPLHVGAGSSVGAIDQPVQRERHTGFPIIPGSSVKGVLRDLFKDQDQNQIDEVFGTGSDREEARSGTMSFGEARLVAFPVRSAKGAFALAVSPLTLSRLNRDAGWGLEIPQISEDTMTCCAGKKLVIERGDAKGVVLEEYRFNQTGEFPTEWEEKLTGLLSDSVLASAKGRFVLLSDGDLSHFAINACQVNQHVRIFPETGTADSDGGGLFNEETVPSETLFYSNLNPVRKCSGENNILHPLNNEQLIQFGGNSTTGLGFCSVVCK